MSEYWKSTPRYWCKHCKTFVRDTKLEKANHEATAKHQGNIKRFIRDLHRGHEREEREKDKAKSEIERLNGVVSGTPATRTKPAESRSNAASLGSGVRELTPAERKAQFAKLAEMGVAVPDDYRQAVAMPGDWQTVAERPIWNNVKKEESLEDIKDFEPGSTLNVGVRKRKFEGHEEEEGAGATVVKKGWGLAMRRYPGAGGGEDDDLDMLLSTKPMSEPGSHSQSEKASAHLNAGDLNASQRPRGVEAATHVPPVKQEESNESVDLNGVPSQNGLSEAMVKQEDDSIPSAVVFKKRKAKSSAILS